MNLGFLFYLKIRFKEQMAPGGRPPHRAIPQVPGVLPQTAALHLVAAGDPHHQDCVLLHCPGLHQRGMEEREKTHKCHEES